MRNTAGPLQESTANILSSQSLPTSLNVERKLGECELSYFLPSRESGVNDMCVHSHGATFQAN